MKSVGIRNLKDQLSRYIGYVREGDVVLVTDHDEVVAQIVPPGPLWATDDASKERATLARMASLGHVRLGHRTAGAPRRPLAPPSPTVDLARLLEDTRGDRD